MGCGEELLAEQEVWFLWRQAAKEKAAVFLICVRGHNA
jgi:hypothetical protein